MKSETGPVEHPGAEVGGGVPTMQGDTGEKGCFESQKTGGFRPAEFEMPVDHGDGGEGTSRD